MTDAVDLAATRAERFPTSDELTAEWFATKQLPPPAVTCTHCGSALCKDTKDRWVHVFSGLCSRAVPVQEDRR